MKRSLLSLIGLFLSLSCASLGKNGSRAAIQRGNEQFKNVLSEGDPPAIAIRKIVNDEVAVDYSGGKRSTQFEELVTPEDKWQLSANVKPMTAYLIGILIDQGKLSLDTRIGQVLPGFARLGSSVENVRVRDLLSHRAGLKELHELSDTHTWTDALNSGRPAREQRAKLVRAILAEKPKFAAGSKFAYSNSGFLVLGEIIETVAKQAWEHELTARLFRPLGMSGCGFGASRARAASPPELPWGHSLSGGRMISVQTSAVVDENFENSSALGPSAVIACDIDSWSKFLIEMLAASKGRSRILKPETARELYSVGKDGVALGGWGAKYREWAKGVTYTMSGTDDMSYALFFIAPQESEIIMAAANSGTEKAHEVLTNAVKSLSD